MKKRYILTFLLCFILLVSIITNPSDKDEYGDWITTQFTKKEGAILGFLSGKVTEYGTTKKDYVLFTIYKTNYDNNKKPMVAIGVFNNFIWINEGE